MGLLIHPGIPRSDFMFLYRFSVKNGPIVTKQKSNISIDR